MIPADLFWTPKHGRDGLSGISETHPEYALPASFDPKHLSVEANITSAELILDILEKEEPNTVTIIALGPCEYEGWPRSVVRRG